MNKHVIQNSLQDQITSKNPSSALGAFSHTRAEAIKEVMHYLDEGCND